ncbi:MAG: fasciclin domain-containing protein [Janibacter sp.]
MYRSTTKITRMTTVLAAVALPLGLTACGGGMDSGSSDEGGSSSSKSMDSEEGASSGKSMAAPFGEGCSTVPKDGKGSFDGMAKDPVATAAGNNPALSSLVGAVKKAELATTLNSAKDITVFAPTNDAFKAMDQATMDKAMNDPKGLLSTVLTHHVVEGKLAPEDLAGTHTTMAGDNIMVKGSDEKFTVGKANVVCGNVQTANATVYIVDSVLMPSAKM